MNPFLKFLRGIGGEKSKIDERRRLYRLGRDEYKYCDGDHCLLLQIDLLKGQPNRVVYSSTIETWLPPHDSEPIESGQRKEIADRIGRFLEENGDVVEVR